jgi:hypothetical protein
MNVSLVDLMKQIWERARCFPVVEASVNISPMRALKKGDRRSKLMGY